MKSTSTPWPEGAVPSGFQVHVVKPRFALSYYGKNLALLRALRQARKTERFDAVVGFNKLPGLDVYYAADPCYAARLAEKGWLHRLTPRHRQFAAFERAVFAPKAGVEVLMIAPSQIDHFIAAYGTPAERFHLLPPPINRDRIAPPNAAVLRKNWRWDTGVAPDERVVLMIASAFRIKGVDRALLAMAALPQDVLAKTRLFVVGGDDAAPYQRQAQAWVSLSGWCSAAPATTCRAFCWGRICCCIRLTPKTPAPCCWRPWWRACRC